MDMEKAYFGQPNRPGTEGCDRFRTLPQALRLGLRISVFGFFLSLLLLSSASAAPAPSPAFVPSRVTPPAVTREMRAVWIATVANLDWPSTNAVTPAQQKAELLAMLDRAAQLNLNTVIFQVRPACDALYASAIDPWSEYLTGTMGKAPQPFYDPLAFAVAEAHKRGLELHAWFNPFRARHFTGKSPASAQHISKTRPDLVKKYGSYLWLDPGEKDVQDYTLEVVMDVVKRYDIDGVHIDDYFYPDKKDAGTEQEFPDEASWKRSGMTSKMDKDEWRRQNVNRFIQRVHDSIKAVKPQVKFGISPFGIWRPKNPPQIQGKDAYAERYADSRLWLSKGWVDYFAPQLYWRIDPPDQSFPVLLKWWTDQNTKNRLLCPGLNTFNATQTWKPEEIINQIKLTRKQTGTAGHIHWRISALMQNEALATRLKRELYGEPALMPAMPWLGRKAPPKPKLTAAEANGRLSLSWSFEAAQEPWLWVVQTRTKGIWSTQILPRENTGMTLSSAADAVAVTAVSRLGNASAAMVMEKK
jgi:uncharacterized lipoprotein YddW (UPF0748 family)